MLYYNKCDAAGKRFTRSFDGKLWGHSERIAINRTLAIDYCASEELTIWTFSREIHSLLVGSSTFGRQQHLSGDCYRVSHSGGNRALSTVHRGRSPPRALIFHEGTEGPDRLVRGELVGGQLAWTAHCCRLGWKG